MADDDMPPDRPADDARPGRAEVSADAALERLRAGKPVENARVSKLKLSGRFDHPVRFKNCLLVRPEVDAAVFRADVSFVGCTVDGVVCHKPSVCQGRLDFRDTVLSKASLCRLTVDGEFSAAYCEFRGKLTVSDCTFGGPASFWEARFAVWVNVKGCRFAAVADFRTVTCDQGFVLSGCTFAGDFLFRGATVGKKFDADGCRFDGLVDLSKAKLNDYVYLEGIQAGPNQAWAFLNAVAERVRVRPAQVEKRLASENDRRYDDAMLEYGLLKAGYQKLHRLDHEDWAFYRFKVCQRKSRRPSWRRPWAVWRAAAEYLFLDLGCGYGTDPTRAVRMASVIVFGFALLYAANVDQFYTDKLPFPDRPRDGLANAGMIGLTTSVSVFTSGMGGIREIAKGWMNLPVMAESVMGTLLFGLFVVAFSRKVIR